MRFGAHFGYWGLDFDADNVRPCLEQASAAGASTFEMLPLPILNGDKAKSKELKRIADDVGIELLFCFRFPEGYDMAGTDADSRKKAVEYLSDAVRGIAEMGCRELGWIIYAKWPGRFDDSCLSKEDKRIATAYSMESMRSVSPIAEEYGVDLNLEVVNRYEHYVLNTIDEGLKFCRAVNSKRVKLLLDCYHMNIEEDSLKDAIVTAKDYIGHFHVSEPNRRIPFHEERLNWTDIGMALKSTGYNGTVTLESFPLSLGSASHRTRIWRDVIPDASIEARLKTLSEGIAYIKARFD